MRTFKLPNFKARGELALGFWWHINPHVAYKKQMLQGYFLARDRFYICDCKFAHGPTEMDATFPDFTDSFPAWHIGLIQFVCVI